MNANRIAPPVQTGVKASTYCNLRARWRRPRAPIRAIEPPREILSHRRAGNTVPRLKTHVAWLTLVSEQLIQHCPFAARDVEDFAPGGGARHQCHGTAPNAERTRHRGLGGPRTHPNNQSAVVVPPTLVRLAPGRTRMLIRAAAV